jgi:RimJ/RimL family protein N-acetyltransferase
MNIIGKSIILRAIEQEDLPLLQKWSNDPEINYMLGGWHFPSSTQDQLKWFQSLNLNSLNQRFAIEAPQIGLIGMANLVDVNWKDRNAFHGILLGDIDVRGKGYGTDTVMTIMRYAFEELNLQRLDTTIIEYNAPSLKLYTERCGWKIEGRKKNYYFRKNRYWDVVIIGIDRGDYFENQNILNYWK